MNMTLVVEMALNKHYSLTHSLGVDLHLIEVKALYIYFYNDHMFFYNEEPFLTLFSCATVVQ